MSDSDTRHPVRECLIVNARSAKSGTAAAEALPVLAAQGWDVTVREKREKGKATDLAQGAAKDGYDPIVNCGGDGTQNEFTTEGILNTGRQMASLLLRRHPNQVSSETYGVSHLTLHAETPLPVQFDGSALDAGSHHGPVRYDFSVIPEGLTILVPRTYDGELFQHGMVPVNGKKRGKGKKKKDKNKSL